MLKRKRLREKGKTKLSEYFKKINKGDRVALKRNLSYKANFPKRMQGKTGVVTGTRGAAKIIEIKDRNKMKKFVVKPIHLKKLTS